MDLMVIPMSTGEYVLQIRSERFTTDHRVDVPVRMLDELGLSRDRARDVIARSVDWFSDQGEDLPAIVDLGAAWDGEPDFRRFLADQLSDDGGVGTSAAEARR
jgi:hypothetical protein